MYRAMPEWLAVEPHGLSDPAESIYASFELADVQNFREPFNSLVRPI
jgi:hypothetical protein